MSAMRPAVPSSPTSSRFGRFVPGLLLSLAAPGALNAAQQVTDLPGADRPLSPTLDEVYRVGGVEGTGWQEFAGMDQMAFDAAGNLYVLDRRSQRVVVVSPTGALVRTHELQGGGPGEFRNPMTLAVTLEGALSVFDAGHMALIHFGPDGAFVGHHTHDPSRGLPLQGMAATDAGDLVYGGGVSFSSGGGSADAGGADTRPLRRIDREGGAPETAFEAWAPPQPEMETSTAGGGMRMRFAGGSVAFAPGLHFGVLPGDLIAVADTTDYAVKLVARDGTVRRVLRRPLAPAPTTEADIEAYREQRMNAMSGSGAPGVMMIRSDGGSSGGGAQSVEIGRDQIREMAEQMLEQTTYADVRSVVAGLATDPDGHIWVERAGPRHGEDGPIDVLSLEGAYLGTIPPNGMRIPEAFGPNGLTAYVELDDFDVPTLVVRRLRSPLR